MIFKDATKIQNGRQWSIPIFLIRAKTLKLEGVVNYQNTQNKVVPRIQQWPLDIPQ